MKLVSNIKLGNEIEVKTKDGQIFKGIFVSLENGYLSSVAFLGIINMIPLSSVANIVKI